jgi:hypothetical protein
VDQHHAGGRGDDQGERVTAAARRRTSCLLAVGAAVTTSLGGGAVTALADSPPVVANVLPGVAVLTGQPLHMTVTGANLTHTVGVTLAPAVPGLSFAVANDQTLLVTLPASIAAGTYNLMVTTTGGLSDPGSAPAFTVTAPLSTSSAAPPPPPRYSFAPTPTQAPAGGAGVGTSSGTGSRSARPAATPAHPGGAPVSPLLLLPLGFAIGALTYLMWGRPGRLAAASRRDLGAQLVARPAQALHIGRICLHCGRLHLILRTRRDLWRAGQFCSATCFVAAQEEDSAAREAESAAHARLEQIFRDPAAVRRTEEPPGAGRRAPSGTGAAPGTGPSLLAADGG